jgi:glycosyltransferase involved in cell wall biosynthesis
MRESTTSDALGGCFPGRSAWVFTLGHGHYAQFLNFRECIGESGRALFVGLNGKLPEGSILRLLPRSIRYRLGEVLQVSNALRGQSWDTVFIASENTGLLPLVQQNPTFLYTDLTPSLKEELSPWYDHQASRLPVVQALKERAHGRMYRACRGVFTMSKWAARGIASDYRVPQDRVHVTLPGANLRRWRFIDRSGRPSSRPVRILMVGGQFRLKGGNLLLDWAERTTVRNWRMDIVTWPGELPPWVHAVLGNPAPDDKASDSLAPRLPQVHVHCGLKANSPELGELFEQADVFCLPTQADGSSIATLEAMAAGLPVAVSAVGGIPELVEDGVTGLLVRRSDSGDLATKLQVLIANESLRAALGYAARKACETHLNVDRQLREILTVMSHAKEARA